MRNHDQFAVVHVLLSETYEDITWQQRANCFDPFSVSPLRPRLPLKIHLHKIYRFPKISKASLRPPRSFTRLCLRISGASHRYAIHSNRGHHAFFSRIPDLKLNRKNVPPSRKFSKVRGHHHTIPPSASLLKALLVRSDAESV